MEQLAAIAGKGNDMRMKVPVILMLFSPILLSSCGLIRAREPSPVAFCQLASQAAKYDRQEVRVRAVLRAAPGVFSEFVNPECPKFKVSISRTRDNIPGEEQLAEAIIGKRGSSLVKEIDLEISGRFSSYTESGFVGRIQYNRIWIVDGLKIM